MTTVERLTPGRLRLVCGALFLIAMCARVAALALAHWRPQVEFAEMELVARNLAETGTLGNPYSLPTGPSAHHAPFYPLLLSLIYRGLGYGRGAAIATAAMNLGFASATVALLPLLVRAIGLPVSVGVAAGLLDAVPFRIIREVRWEAAMNALILLLCTLLAIAWLGRAAPNRTPRSFGIGAVFGLALIAMPMYLCILAAFATLVAIHAVRQRRMWLGAQAAVLLAGAAAGVSPWIVRNYVELGAPIFVRDNYPLELSLSNRDGAYAQAQYNFAVGFPNNFQILRHPWSSQAEARRVQQMGEAAYEHARLEETLEWCRRRTGAFLRLTAERFFVFWFTIGETQVYKSIFLALLRAVGLWGAVLMLRPWDPNRMALYAVLLGYPLPYYFIQIDTRYEYPLDWCMYLLVAYAGYRAARRYGKARATAPKAV